MLRALSLALASTMIAQAPDDMVLCTSASDCPAGAACEDGVCVMVESEAPPPEEPVKRKKRRRVRRRRRDPNRCYRDTCNPGEHCYRGACSVEPVPSRGTGLLISGAVLGGVSLVFFASAAVCQLDDGRTERDQNVCTAIQSAIGAVALAVGVPLLTIGAIRRVAFNEWLKTYHPHLAIVPKEEGAVAAIGFAF